MNVAVPKQVISCDGCKYHKSTSIFELCQHAESLYFIEGKGDFHTIGHMRGERGKCGPDKKLFQP